ncbi:DNA-3-methyladenine glycosylase family protein [Marinobacterium aestuariivivens]|uniref:DNA-3-methyladenine glycosylase II n=1 Tax=Marinobacterium aestuariivivens TaxID=1698799 RepID=A0ABW2A1P4_9GAMM
MRAIIGQQVSVAAARTLAHRFCERFGDPVETGQPGLNRIFPDATAIATLDADAIAGLGIVGARARALVTLAQAAADDPTLLQPGIDIDDRIARLQALPGIGPWTAQYIAMRALSWPDAFPHSDLGLLKALNTRSPAEALTRAEPWRPWRAYAVMHLWLQLEEASRP